MDEERAEVEGEGRWPRSVYGVGTEPDYRFSLANERTFLAWIRTALALLAAGVALHTLPTGYPEAVTRYTSLVLTVGSVLTALASWLRWSRAERAIRQDAPIGGMRTGMLVAAVTVVVALVAVAMVVWS